MLERILEWDRETFIYLNSLGIEAYDEFWSAVTNIETWIPLYILFFILYAFKFPRREALTGTILTLALLGFVLIVTDLTKEYVGRLRPNNNEDLNTLIRILKTPTSFSFFSGHAATSFSVMSFVFLFLRKKISWIWVLFLWPVIFSLSRIYVGVHYPVDIIAGALFGIGSALLFYFLYKRFIRPYIRSTHPGQAG